MKKLILLIVFLIVGFSFSAEAQIKNDEGHIYVIEQINLNNVQLTILKDQSTYDLYVLDSIIETENKDRLGVYIDATIVKEALASTIVTDGDTVEQARNKVFYTLLKNNVVTNYQDWRRNKWQTFNLLDL